MIIKPMLAKSSRPFDSENHVFELKWDGRIGKAKIYEFKQTRLNKYYEQKRVEVFYTINKNKIVTVTVYVFYGKWEGVK